MNAQEPHNSTWMNPSTIMLNFKIIQEYKMLQIKYYALSTDIYNTA